MTGTAATARGTALGLLTLLLLSGGAAHASAIAASFDEPLTAVLGDERLASPVLGCWDPDSWVWTGARAERVAVVVATLGPCEIGTEDCARQPESALPEPPVATAYEVAALTCALKQAQHEQRDGTEPFDAKSCFEAEMTLWSLEDVEPAARQPYEGLSCTEQDPECRSAPPQSQPPELFSPAPAAVSVIAPVRPPGSARPLRPDCLGEALAGIAARVERPPTP